MRVKRLRSFIGFVLASAACAAAAEPSFVPVFRGNFPDPFIVENKGEFIAYATNNGINLPMLTSRDLVHWTAVADPSNPGKPLDGLPQLGSWAREGFTWAPEVMELNGRWLLYYTARSRKLDAQCIGVATADNPKGPFRDQSATPIVCQTDLGGSIDGNPFKDADGKLYLLFKNDGNRIRKRTSIWGQQLAPDGLTVVGTAAEMLRDDQPWEERVVEAPTMVRTPTGYQLFFSGGFFGWNPDSKLSPYAMGYANCSGPIGPCKASATNPILHSFNESEAGCLSGPGHQAIFTAANRTFLAFHAWSATKGCRNGDDKRNLYVAPLFWKDGEPQIGPSLRMPGGR
ncbi:MAG: glycoside hydrolase family 43 protein [Sphingomicrobium sp.]